MVPQAAGRIIPIAMLVVVQAVACQGGGGGECTTCPVDTCGDGAIGPGEECDPGADPPASWELGTRSCADLDGDGVLGEAGEFTGGTLGCSAGCALDVSGCTWACGDGVLNGGEDCDGAQLGGATCASEGFPGGGELACAPGCSFVTSGCHECATCADCGGNACVDHSCGACSNDHPCCPPLQCSFGVCTLL